MSGGAGQGVPFFDLTVQYQGLHKSLEEAVLRVLRSGSYILGPEVKSLEEEVAAFCGAARGVGCASGTDALSLALKCLEIGPGDEVIVPPFTFFATAACVSRLGATPVFCDIDPDSFNIDPLQVENKITPRTKAIVPVHMFGQCAEMEPLWSAAERHNLPIIEDGAQALGAEYQGKRVGTLGTMACLSFYPTKNLGSFGDAGMVVTSDPDYADRLACLRVHGMSPKYHHGHLGWNARLDALQAALLRVKMPWLPRFLDARIAIAQRYDELIQDHHLEHFLRRPVVQPNRRHTFNQYCVRVADGLRDSLCRHFQSNGIGYEIYYPRPLHLQEAFRCLGHGVGDFPASERACEEVLALPMYPELSWMQQKRVIESVAAFVRQPMRRAA